MPGIFSLYRVLRREAIILEYRGVGIDVLHVLSKLYIL